MNVTKVLAGRREGELLAFPSVHRMADILAQRCREPSWVRTSVATLERFRTLTGHADLEMLLAQARAEPAIAEEALASFASALSGYTDVQVSALAMGAKIWFRLNGVAIPWRPLPGISSPPVLSTGAAQETERIMLLALIGSGLRLAELLRLRRRDIGSLDAEAGLIPDIEADPLAVQYTPRRGKPIERITFLTYSTRQALLAFLAHDPLQSLDLDAPLITQRDGSKATTASIARARRRSQSLIRAGSEVNVTLCRTTGDFFREWGLPGSRFTGPEDYNIEEYI
jgi:integrase